MYNGEKHCLFNKWCWENQTNTCKSNEIGPLSYTTHKNQLKWIKDLNVRLETVKLLEENTGEKFLDVVLGNKFLDKTPKAQATKAKINKQDYIKLKVFRTAKDTISKMKR